MNKASESISSGADRSEVPPSKKALRWKRRCYLLQQEQAYRRFWNSFFDLVESGLDFEIRAESSHGRSE